MHRKVTVVGGAVDFSNPQGAVVVRDNQQSTAVVGRAHRTDRGAGPMKVLVADELSAEGLETLRKALPIRLQKICLQEIHPRARANETYLRG